MKLEEWEKETPKEEVNVAMLDQLVIDRQAAREEYEEKKKIATEAHYKVQELDAKILATLEACSKTAWEVEGLGRAYTINKYVVKMPKDSASKKKLLKFMRNELGEEGYTGMVTVNHNTLNSFYNELQEQHSGDCKIPGLSEPTHQVSLGFRKKSK